LAPLEENDEELDRIRAKKLEAMKEELSGTQGSSEDNWPTAPVILTEENFEEIVNKYSMIVVDCWAPWCSPCQMVGPVVKELAKDYQGKIVFGKLNTDENQGLTMKFNIMSIPTFLIFKNGDLIDRPVGAMPKAALEAAITQYLD
jgi:thioredoxin 1